MLLHGDRSGAELNELVGATLLLHPVEDRLLLEEEVAFQLEQQRAATLDEREAVGSEAAHLGKHLVHLFVLAHAVGEGVVAGRDKLGAEGREHHLLLDGFVRRQLTDDVEEKPTDLRRIALCVEQLDELVDQSVIAFEELDDIGLLGHRRILSSAFSGGTARRPHCRFAAERGDRAKGPCAEWHDGQMLMEQGRKSRYSEALSGLPSQRRRTTTESEPAAMTEDGDTDVAGVTGFEVISNTTLSPDVHRLVIRAPRVAAVRQPGQFVIVRLGPGAERTPLTIAESDAEEGSIVVVIQAVGKSTSDLAALAAGSRIHDVVGPLGRPSDLITSGTAVCVAGGVGAAVIYPIARRLAEIGVDVITVLGARTSESVLYADEFASFGEMLVCTNDGSAGRAGFVTDELRDVLAARSVDVVYAAGPVPMMSAVAAVTKPLGIRTIVSLNPIMVDGTGMCGGCRVTVNGVMRFACVDGPEFDARDVDFAELADRLGTYRESELTAATHACRGSA